MTPWTVSVTISARVFGGFCAFMSERKTRASDGARMNTRVSGRDAHRMIAGSRVHNRENRCCDQKRGRRAGEHGKRSGYDQMRSSGRRDVRDEHVTGKSNEVATNLLAIHGLDHPSLLESSSVFFCEKFVDGLRQIFQLLEPAGQGRKADDCKKQNARHAPSIKMVLKRFSFGNHATCRARIRSTEQGVTR